MTAVVHPKRPAADDYLELVRQFPLRTLRTSHEHAEAVKRLTRLLGRKNARQSSGEREYAEVLGRLIEDFDPRESALSRRRHTPVELLKFLMSENCMNTTDLGKVLGSKTAASLVLNGKRELSKGHIRRLAARFSVEPGLFI